MSLTDFISSAIFSIYESSIKISFRALLNISVEMSNDLLFTHKLFIIEYIVANCAVKTFCCSNTHFWSTIYGNIMIAQSR